MAERPFIVIGENIHCTRIFKVGGKYCKPNAAGEAVIHFDGEHGPAELPVPAHFTANADWEAGRIKHCAVAIWQGCYGATETDRALGSAYLQAMAKEQAAHGAHFLDVNVDEFSTDVDERVRLMDWTIKAVQQTAGLPVSVDSSNTDILEAGLKAANRACGRPLVNSASLDRVDAIAVAHRHDAVLILSAAGETDMPAGVDDRLANIARIIAQAEQTGYARKDLYIDPLVFPIATDGQNGVRFLDTVMALRATYGSDIHIAAGLSNISFGMPNRKLINQVFSRLAYDLGADGGIVDPLQINGEILRALDPGAKAFKLARALLTGEDDFGMEFITAARAGEL